MKRVVKFLSIYLSFAVLMFGNIYAEEMSVNTIEQINIKFNRTGRIYPKGEKIIFSLTDKNTSGSTIKVIYNYGCILTNDNINAGTYEKEVIFSANEVKKIVFEVENPNIYGIHKLKISRNSGEGNVLSVGEESEEEFSVSMSISNGEANPDYGICQHVIEHNEGSMDVNNSLVPNAGINIIRDGYRWELVEKEIGVLKFEPEIKEKFRAMNREGIKILYTLGLGNPFYDNGAAPKSPEAVEGYARYCAFVAEELKGIVDCFEIWNEYNYYGSFNPTEEPPETYANMLKAAYTAIKNVNPEATVIGLSMGGIYPSWAKRVFSAGGYDYLDAVSLHPYEYTNVFDEEKLINGINSIKDLMKEHSKGKPIKPIWITEIGFSTYEGDTGFSENDQAKNTVLSYAVTKAYDLADKYIQYQLCDRDDLTNKESCWGILRKTNSQKYVPSGAKPSYLAVAALNNFIGKDTQYKSVINDGRYYAFNFYNKRINANIALVQSYKGEKTVKYNFGCNTVDLYDMYGNKIKRLFSENGIYELSVNEMPQYAIGAFEKFEKSAEESKMTEIPFSYDKTGQDGMGNIGGYIISIKDITGNPISNSEAILNCGEVYITLPQDFTSDKLKISITYDDFMPVEDVKVRVFEYGGNKNQACAEGITGKDGMLEINPTNVVKTVAAEDINKYSNTDDMYKNGWNTGEWGNEAVLLTDGDESYVELSKTNSGNDISLKYELSETQSKGYIKVSTTVRFSKDASGVIAIAPSAVTEGQNGSAQPVGINLISFSSGKLSTQVLGNQTFFDYIPNEWYNITAVFNFNTHTYDIQIGSNEDILGAYTDIPMEIQNRENVIGTANDIKSVSYGCLNGTLHIKALKIEQLSNIMSNLTMAYESFDNVTFDNAKYHGISNPFGNLSDEIVSFVEPENYPSKVVQLKGDKHILKEILPISRGKYKISYKAMSGNGRFFVEINDDGNCNGGGGIFLPYVEKGKVWYNANNSETPRLLGETKVGSYVTIECTIDFDKKCIAFSVWNADTGIRVGKEITIFELKEDVGNELSSARYIHFLKWYDSFPGYIDDFKVEYCAEKPLFNKDNIAVVDYKGNRIIYDENEKFNSAIKEIIIKPNFVPDTADLEKMIVLSKTDTGEIVNTDCCFNNNEIVLGIKSILDTDSEYKLIVSKELANERGVKSDKDFEIVFKTDTVRQILMNEDFDGYSNIDSLYNNNWQTGEWGNKATLVNDGDDCYVELSKVKTGKDISIKYNIDKSQSSGCVRVTSRVRFSPDASGVIEAVPNSMIDNGNGVLQPLGVTLLTYSRGTMQTQLMGGRKFFDYIPNEWYNITATLNFDTKSYDIQITNNGNVIGAYSAVPLEIQSYTKILGTAEDLANIRYRCWGGELDVGNLKIERVLKGTSSMTVSSENFNNINFDTAKKHGIFAPFGETLESLISFEKPDGDASNVLAFNAFDKHIMKEFSPISDGKFRISYKYKITGERMFIELRQNSINDPATMNIGNILLPYSAFNGNVYYYDNELSGFKKFGRASMGSWVTFDCEIDFDTGTVVYSARDSESGELVGKAIEQDLVGNNGTDVDYVRYFHISSWGSAPLYIDDFRVERISQTQLISEPSAAIALEDVTVNGEKLLNVAQMTKGSIINVRTEVLNVENVDKNLLWIIAYYKDGICKKTEYKEGVALQNALDVPIQSFVIPPEAEDADSAKIMLWDSINRMVCYCESITVK